MPIAKCYCKKQWSEGEGMKISRNEWMLFILILLALVVTTIFKNVNFWVVAGGVAQIIAVYFTFKALAQSEKSLIQSEKSLKYVLMPRLHFSVKYNGDDQQTNIQGIQKWFGTSLLSITNSGQGAAKNINLKVYRKRNDLKTEEENLKIKSENYQIDDEIFYLSHTSYPCTWSLNKDEEISILKSQEENLIEFCCFKDLEVEGAIVITYKTDYALEPKLENYILFSKQPNENSILFKVL